MEEKVTKNLTAALDKDAEELLEVARATIDKHFAVGRHHVACAIKTSSGNTYPGIHMDCAGFDNCAEPIAMANACLADDNDIVLAVAVMKDSRTQEIDVINPCGNCLQHFLVFAPNIEVVAQTPQGVRRLGLKELFPYPYEH
jgi:cytidine deaminase